MYISTVLMRTGLSEAALGLHRIFAGNPQAGGTAAPDALLHQLEK